MTRADDHDGESRRALLDRGVQLALILALAFANRATERVFDGEKAVAVRCSVVALVWLGLGLGLMGSPQSSRAARLLGVLALAIVATASASAAFGVSPWVSVVGSYTRGLGVLTDASFAALAVVVAATAHGRHERVVDTILALMIPLTVYGLVQARGADSASIDWSFVEGRVGSLTGHPVFLGAVVAMVLPLAVVRLRRLWSIRRGSDRRWLFAMALVALLACGILIARSRAPALGAVVGLGVTLLATSASASRARRWLVVLVVAGIGATALSLVIPAAGHGAGDGSSVLRLLRLPEPSHPMDRTRLLLWEGMTELVRAHPERWLLGFGPETLEQVYPGHAPAALRWHSPFVVSPSRSHNANLDLVAHTGPLGWAAEMALWSFLVVTLLARLGLVATVLDHAKLGALALGGGVLALGAATVVAPGFHVQAVSFGLGVAAGLSVFVAYGAVRRGALPAGCEWSGALLGGLVAHWVEIQFSFPAIPSRALFWVFAGLAVLDREKVETERVPPTLEDVRSLGSMAAPILAVLVFYFWVATPYLEMGGGSVALVLVLAWAGPALLAIPTRPRGWHRRAWRVYARVSLIPAAAFAVIHVLALWWGVGPAAGFAFLGMWALAWWLRDDVSVLASSLRLTTGRQRIALALAVPLGCAIAHVSVQASRADMHRHAAQVARDGDDTTLFTDHLQAAVATAPRESEHWLQLGDAHMDVAASEPSAEARVSRLMRARAAFLGALALRPDSGEVLARLARVDRARAELALPAEAASLRATAEDRFRLALEARPNDVVLWNEWATVAMNEGRLTEAGARLRTSARIAPDYPETQALTGHLRLREGDPAAAVRALETAVKADAGLLSAWAGLAYARAQLGALEEARNAARRALRLDPANTATRLNLAGVLRRQGQIREALREAQRAREHAGPEEAFACETATARLVAAGPEPSHCVEYLDGR